MALHAFFPRVIRDLFKSGAFEERKIQGKCIGVQVGDPGGAVSLAGGKNGKNALLANQ
jgi:hypothetical protein